MANVTSENSSVAHTTDMGATITSVNRQAETETDRQRINLRLVQTPSRRNSIIPCADTTPDTPPRRLYHCPNEKLPRIPVHPIITRDDLSEEVLSVAHSHVGVMLAKYPRGARGKKVFHVGEYRYRIQVNRQHKAIVRRLEEVKDKPGERTARHSGDLAANSGSPGGEVV